MDKSDIKYELINVYKRYSTNKFFTINDVSLTVKAGEIFGFLGPNGAGKSTIIKTTMGITNITKGTIKVCGIDISKNPTRAKEVIGYVPDQYVLYEKLTGREYLESIGDIYKVEKSLVKKRIEEYIEKFHIKNAIDRPIQGYSHGMKQKIALIAALIHAPKLWILDEPLTGLDPISVYQVKETMKEYAKKGNIVFFSSHLIDIVKKLCTRIAIIHNGEIKAVVTMKDIKKTGKTLENFYLDTINQK